MTQSRVEWNSVFAEVIGKFARSSDFRRFARSGNGLSLSGHEVTTVIENYRFVEEQKCRLLLMWTEKNVENATPQILRDLVSRYYASDHKDSKDVSVTRERLEDVFQDVVGRISTKEFGEFARLNEPGLNLSDYVIATTQEDSRFSMEECKLAMLWEWRYKTCNRITDDTAVAEKIRKLVEAWYIINRSQKSLGDRENQFIGKPKEDLEPSTDMPSVDKAGQSQIIPSEGGVKPFQQKSSKAFALQPSTVLKKSSFEPTMSGKIDDAPTSSKEGQRSEKSGSMEFCRVLDEYMKCMLACELKSFQENGNIDITLPSVTALEDSKNVDVARIHADDSVNHVMLLGDTGSGKTIFALKYAMLASEKNLFFSTEIEMIYYLDVSKLYSKQRTTSFDLLFVQQLGLELPEYLHDSGSNWLKLNSPKVLLVLDGLDQSQTPLEGDYPKIGVDSVADTNTIIANVLSGHIYPGMKLLSTSRWHAYWKLPPNMKTSETLVLKGYDVERRNQLLENIFGSKSKSIISYWKRNDAFAVVSNPLFMKYITETYKNTPTDADFNFTTMMVSILRLFSGSRHKVNVESLVPKFMKLAFHGMIQNRFVFTANYIESLNMDMKDMRGLVEMDADNRFIECVAEDDDMRIRFLNQHIQEILASLYACCLAFDDFTEFIEDNYKKSGMKVVIKHIFIIILNESASETASKFLPDNLHKKSEYLLEYLGKLLDQKVISDKRIVSILHECGPDMFKQFTTNAEEFDFTEFDLHSGEQNTLLYFANNAESLNSIRMSRFKICSENLPLVISVLGCNISIQTNILRIIDLDCENLQELSEAIRNGVLTAHTVSLMNTLRLEASEYFLFGQMLHLCGSRSLNLEDNNLSSEKITDLNNAVVKYNVILDDLRIYGHFKTNLEEFELLAELLKNTKTRAFTAKGFCVTYKHLSSFTAALQEKQVTLSYLNIEGMASMSPADDDITMISRLAQKVDKSLTIWSLKLNESQKNILLKEIGKLSEDWLALSFRQIDNEFSMIWSTKNEIDIDADKPLIKEIGPDGGFMWLYDCKLLVPCGAVKTKTTFCLSVNNFFDDFPDDLLPITPVIECNPSITFETPVTLTMKTNFNSKDNREIPVKILHSEKDGEWTMIKDSKLVTQSEIVFEVNDFCKYCNGIEEDICEDGIFTFINDLYMQKQTAQIISVLTRNCSDHERTELSLGKKGFVGILPLEERLNVGLKSKIEIKIESDDNSEVQLPNIQPQNEIIEITKDIVRQGFSHLCFTPSDSIRDKRGQIRIKYSIIYSERSRHVPVIIVWPIKESGPENINVHTEINTGPHAYGIMIRDNARAEIQEHGSSITVTSGVTPQ